MLRSVLLVFSICVVSFALTACETASPVKVKDPQLVAQPDKVSMMLAQAADRASNALETLAAVEQKRTPEAGVPAIGNVPAELRRAVTVSWVGPVDSITKMLADRAGYRFVELGAKSATPVVVDIAVTNKPVIEVMRSIGLQLGPRGNLHVNSADKVVELSYAPVTGMGDGARGF
ncbi:MAG TPA: DotD/TraH family lipoprotein [Alphaproteobacteria bacterium]|nr:DotD/TraH family lipoprotein [Alphaproteobacteria bacterium]HOO50617.1 DotD/TraH family lipoprotein [Alphaproteobacteria bacterium]